MSKLQEKLTAHDNKLARQHATELRRCLSCENWMRSTGPDHRICNTCKWNQYPQNWVGARIA